MGYEDLADVVGVTLGGLNKTTGRANPTQLEGYFLRREERLSKKYNKLQSFWIYQTKAREVGLYGSGGLDSEMKKAVVGRMTLVTATGELKDTGKGNPMKVFNVKQDKTNTIEVDSQHSNSSNRSYSDVEEPEDDIDQDSHEETTSYAPAPSHPVVKAPTVNPADAARRAKVQAMLNGKAKSI